MIRLPLSPRFGGILIDAGPVAATPSSAPPGQPVTDEMDLSTNHYQLRFSVVPDLFITGIHYRGETKPSTLADRITTYVEQHEGSAFSRLKPSTVQRLLRTLVRQSPMPWDDKMTALSLIDQVHQQRKTFLPAYFHTADGITAIPGSDVGKRLVSSMRAFSLWFNSRYLCRSSVS